MRSGRQGPNFSYLPAVLGPHEDPQRWHRGIHLLPLLSTMAFPAVLVAVASRLPPVEAALSDGQRPSRPIGFLVPAGAGAHKSPQKIPLET